MLYSRLTSSKPRKSIIKEQKKDCNTVPDEEVS